MADASGLIDRAREGLEFALTAPTDTDRYCQAHIAALRAGAALLAVRGQWPKMRGAPRSVWEHLPDAYPELGEWATYFARTGRRRLELERGGGKALEPGEGSAVLASAREFVALAAGKIT